MPELRCVVHIDLKTYFHYSNILPTGVSFPNEGCRNSIVLKMQFENDCVSGYSYSPKFLNWQKFQKTVKNTFRFVFVFFSGQNVSEKI